MRDTSGKSGTHIGQELNRHINLGVGVGHLQGRRFLQSTTEAPNYNHPYFAINFKDNARGK